MVSLLFMFVQWPGLVWSQAALIFPSPSFFNGTIVIKEKVHSLKLKDVAALFITTLIGSLKVLSPSPPTNC